MLIGLISLAVGPVDASAYVSGLVAAVVVAAFIVVLRTFGTISAPKPPSTPSDGWCSPEEPARRARQPGPGRRPTGRIRGREASQIVRFCGWGRAGPQVQGETMP